RDEMIDHAPGQFGMAYRPPASLERRECKSAREVVQQVAIDVDEVDTARQRCHHMHVPQAIEISVSHFSAPSCRRAAEPRYSRRSPTGRLLPRRSALRSGLPWTVRNEPPER